MTRERIYDILEGDSKASIWYGHIMTAIIVASLVPLCFWEENLAFDILESVCVIVFILDYIARWATADFKLKRGSASFAIYPFTPMAIIDLVTILPSFFALNPAWRTLRALRLLRLLQAFRLIRYSRSVNALVTAFARKREQLLVVLAFATAYVVIIAMVMFNVEHDTFPDFFDAVYWSVVSLTTVGYGDLYPTSDIGRTIAMFSSLVGIAIVALPASILTTGLIEEMDKADNDKEEGNTGGVVHLESSVGDHAGEAEDAANDQNSADEEGPTAEVQ